MNNDNDINLHSMTKLSGWLRHWLNSLIVSTKSFVLFFRVKQWYTGKGVSCSNDWRVRISVFDF